jgi:hypothetical protein
MRKKDSGSKLPFWQTYDRPVTLTQAFEQATSGRQLGIQDDSRSRMEVVRNRAQLALEVCMVQKKTDDDPTV